MKMGDAKCICQECGCLCESCVSNNSLHLHREIEQLKQRLLEREYHIVQMETKVLNHAKQFPNGEWEALKEELRFWEEKYDRLYDSHKKLQKVNQSLEDKLLKIVDKFETEKAALMRDVGDLSTKLVEARLNIAELEEENEQYRNDCNVAIQLLQCKPSHFLAHKFTSLPLDMQEKVKLHATSRSKRDNQNAGNPEVRTIRVPIPTFPPTAMVYSVSRVPASTMVPPDGPNSTNTSANNQPDFVSAAIMAKVLEERAKERTAKKQNRCHACRCKKHSTDFADKATQTKMPSSITNCLCGGVMPAYVHSRRQSECSSASENHCYRTRNGSSTSTETVI